MLIYISGEIKEIHKNSLFLEIPIGLAFEVYVTSTANFVVGNKKKFYVYTHIHNENMSIFGFENLDELKLFKLLIEVNGIGPKTGMQILKNIDINRFVSYVAHGRIEELSKIGGVGNKAERIVAELKNKLSSFNIKEIPYENVFNALLFLGYNSNLIAEVLSELDPNLDESEAMKIAIRGLKK